MTKPLTREELKEQIDKIFDDCGDWSGLDEETYHFDEDSAKKKLKKLAHQYARSIGEELIKGLPDKPFDADKTPKPVLRSVEEGFGFGSVEGVVSTTEDTGFTYTEQDQEDVAFEASRPYLDKAKQTMEKRLEHLCPSKKGEK